MTIQVRSCARCGIKRQVQGHRRPTPLCRDCRDCMSEPERELWKGAA
jgi:hypothetical protein